MTIATTKFATPFQREISLDVNRSGSGFLYIKATDEDESLGASLSVDCVRKLREGLGVQPATSRRDFQPGDIVRATGGGYFSDGTRLEILGTIDEDGDYKVIRPGIDTPLDFVWYSAKYLEAEPASAGVVTDTEEAWVLKAPNGQYITPLGVAGDLGVASRWSNEVDAKWAADRNAEKASALGVDGVEFTPVKVRFTTRVEIV